MYVAGCVSIVEINREDYFIVDSRGVVVSSVCLQCLGVGFEACVYVCG